MRQDWSHITQSTKKTQARSLFPQAKTLQRTIALKVKTSNSKALTWKGLKKCCSYCSSSMVHASWLVKGMMWCEQQMFACFLQQRNEQNPSFEIPTIIQAIFCNQWLEGSFMWVAWILSCHPGNCGFHFWSRIPCQLRITWSSLFVHSSSFYFWWHTEPHLLGGWSHPR